MSEWIPVEKKLPDAYGLYLCTKIGNSGGGRYASAEWYSAINQGWEDEDHWGFKVVAWQPLPKPYEG